MGIINPGNLTYEVSLDNLKQLIASDLQVPVAAVTVIAKMATRGDQRDSWQEFNGVSVIVDTSKIKAAGHSRSSLANQIAGVESQRDDGR